MISFNSSALLQKEMDRKDFLKHVGIGVVAFSSVGAAMKAMGVLPTSMTQLSTQTPAASAAVLGYGNSPYGGGDTPRGASSKIDSLR